MSNVVDFMTEAEKREPTIWKCNECDNCSFLIYDTGSIECVECNSFHENPEMLGTIVRRFTRKGPNKNES